MRGSHKRRVSLEFNSYFDLQELTKNYIMEANDQWEYTGRDGRYLDVILAEQKAEAERAAKERQEKRSKEQEEKDKTERRNKWVRERNKRWEERRTLDSLKAGEAMKSWDSVVSPNGTYKLVFEDNSNLVLSVDKKPIWASDTANQGVRGRASLKDDGDLVLESSHGLIWSSQTAGKGDSSTVLVVEDSGNAVIKSNDQIIWEAPINLAGWEIKMGAPNESWFGYD